MDSSPSRPSRSCGGLLNSARVPNVKRFLLPAIVASGLAACSGSNGLPPLSSAKPDAVQQGTLASKELVEHATASLYRINGGRKPIEMFVIQQPVGKPGKLAWRESWIYDPAGSKRKFILTFEEDGAGSAEYEIGTM